MNLDLHLDLSARRRRSRSIALPLLLSLFAVFAAEPLMSQSTAIAADDDLEAAWRQASTGAVWRSPTTEERDALREAFRILAVGAVDCSASLAGATRLLAAAGFSLRRDMAAGIVVVEELQGGRRGGGLYAMRCGAAKPWVLQAPHSFFDERTGGIVRKLFVESQARFAFWNTVHRYRSRPDERFEDPVHPADVAHEPGSLFQAATLGAAAGDPLLRFVQIHGFESGKVAFDAVLSAGPISEVAPNPGAPDGRAPIALAQALEPVLGRVGVHGQDTERYGALRNVQGIALARRGPGRFLHIELAAEVRLRLRNDPALRAAFLDGLSRAW